MQNKMTGWLDQRFPDAQPYWRIGASVLVVALVPLPFVDVVSVRDAFGTLGAYWGALIGLGGLMVVTRANYEQTVNIRSHDRNSDTYIAVRALSALLVRVEHASSAIRHQFGSLTDPKDAELTQEHAYNLALLSLHSHLPSKEEWLHMATVCSQLNPAIQLAFVAAMARYLDLLHHATYLQGNNELQIDKMSLSAMIESLNGADEELARVRERLDPLSHRLAKSIGVDVSIVRRDGKNWKVEPSPVDPAHFES